MEGEAAEGTGAAAAAGEVTARCLRGTIPGQERQWYGGEDVVALPVPFDRGPGGPIRLTLWINKPHSGP